MIGKWAFNAKCECGKVHDLYRHKGISSNRLTIRCECGKVLHITPVLGSWRLPCVKVA